MKTIPVFALVLSLFSFTSVRADGDSNSIAGTGNEYIQLCNDHNHTEQNSAWILCVGEVNGIARGIKFGITLQTMLSNPKMPYDEIDSHVNSLAGFCVPDDVTREQLALVVSKFLHDHPEILNVQDYAIVLKALDSAWPCKS